MEVHLDRFMSLLDPADADFLVRIWGGDLSRYTERLRQYGFEKHGLVLDAGCGFGQWSVALSNLNKRVAALDNSPERLLIGREITESFRIDNVNFQFAHLETLPFEACSVDAVFCYQALPATKWRDVVREFARVLRPGGHLYLNADGLGYFLHLWHSKSENLGRFHPREVAASGLLNTLRYERGLDPIGVTLNLIEIDELTVHLTDVGFVDVENGPEGTLRHPAYTGDGVAPFFAASYYDETGVYEVLATKG